MTDLDTDDCAPHARHKLLQALVPHPNFLINVAVDEAEAWLMADRINFAIYLGVEEKDVPQASLQKQGGMKPLMEIECSLKTSYYLTHCLASRSKKEIIRQQVAAKGKNCKGKEYNSAIIPFIQNEWNIDNAKQNSDSLSRMIERIKRLSERMEN